MPEISITLQRHHIFKETGNSPYQGLVGKTYGSRLDFLLEIDGYHVQSSFMDLNEYEEANWDSARLYLSLINYIQQYKQDFPLQIFSTNSIMLDSNEIIVVDNIPLEVPITLNVSNETYAQLVDDSKMYLRIAYTFEKCSSYLTSLELKYIPRDEYIPLCFDFIERCLLRSFDRQWILDKLLTAKQVFKRDKPQTDAITYAKKNIFNVSSPHIYSSKPSILKEIEEMLKHI